MTKEQTPNIIAQKKWKKTVLPVTYQKWATVRITWLHTAYRRSEYQI